MRIALITNYLTGYRMPLYERLAASVGLEVLCFGGGERYVPSWFADLDRQIAQAPFPARRVSGTRALLDLGRTYDGVIAGFAGGSTLFASFAGAKLHRKPFILWASIWAQPRSLAHDLAFPASAFVYRYADSVLAYGPHAERFIEPFRRREDTGIFVAPQAVEPELFGRTVTSEEVAALRNAHELPYRPLVLYSGRFVAEKGVEVLLDAWRSVKSEATLVLAGDGPLAARARSTPGVVVVGPLARTELPVLYAAAEFTVLASIPTRLFREPWGLVCNESMHQGRPVIATSAVGAAAGGLVRDMDTGLVVDPGDPAALATAIDRLLADEPLRRRLGDAARNAVKAYNYDAMSDAFEAAIDRAVNGPPS
jgi:glycosyltransferase involved in cell wall biosynthesis